MFSAVYDVQIQDEEDEFCVVSRLGGNDGENMRNIVRTNKEVLLRMIGNKEKPLHIKVDTNSQEGWTKIKGCIC